MEQFQWKVTDNGVVIIGCHENDKYVTIPDCMEGKPVTEIAPKAFLSCKRMEEIQLPAAVCRIGNWAFAHAAGLRRLLLYGVSEASGTELGKDVFLGCQQLQEIRYEDDEYVGMGFLRAAAMQMGARELFQDVRNVASTDSECLGKTAEQVRDTEQQQIAAWLAKWDNALAVFLKEADLKGFRPMWAGGEEDYESEKDLPAYYESKRRCRKAEFCYLRLKYDRMLSVSDRESLYVYLREHSKDCCHEEAWQVIREGHPQEKEYYRILYEAGGISRVNIDALLSDMDRYGAGAEIIAFVLDCVNSAGRGDNGKSDRILSEEDYFTGFVL